MKPLDRNVSILEHIVSYCQQIEQTVERFGDEPVIFQNDPIYRNAAALCILQIGELVGKLTDEFREQHSAIPWRQIKAMRNIVPHSYGTVDPETSSASDKGLFELSSAEPFYFAVERGFAHVQRPHGFNRCDPAGTPVSHDLLEFRCLDGLSAGVLPLLPGNGDPLPLTLQDILPLQLRYGAEHRQHELSGGRGGVDGLLPADKFHALGCQPLHQL